MVHGSVLSDEAIQFRCVLKESDPRILAINRESGTEIRNINTVSISIFEFWNFESAIKSMIVIDNTGLKTIIVMQAARGIL